MVWFLMMMIGFMMAVGGFRIDNMYMFVLGGLYFMTGIIIYELRTMAKERQYEQKKKRY